MKNWFNNMWKDVYRLCSLSILGFFLWNWFIVPYLGIGYECSKPYPFIAIICFFDMINNMGSKESFGQDGKIRWTALIAYTISYFIIITVFKFIDQ